jgi:cytochrome c5
MISDESDDDGHAVAVSPHNRAGSRLMAGIATSLALGLLALCAKAEEQARHAPRSGEQIVQAYCGQCHNTGWQGAPVIGERADWEPRQKAGIEQLLAHSKQGLNAMPPMGMCPDCTDEELQAAIAEMLK